MGNICGCLKKKSKKEVTIILLGLSESGKTEIACKLLNKRRIDFSNTNGAKIYRFKMLDYRIKLIELGGAKDMQRIWSHYYSKAFGFLYVADISDFNTIETSRLTFEEIMKHRFIQGKPVVVFANKVDLNEDLDSYEFCDYFGCEFLANKYKSLLALQVSGKNYTREIIPGFKWLLEQIGPQYGYLKNRIKFDCGAQTQVFTISESNRFAGTHKRIQSETNSNRPHSAPAANYGKDSSSIRSVRKIQRAAYRSKNRVHPKS